MPRVARVVISDVAHHVSPAAVYAQRTTAGAGRVHAGAGRTYPPPVNARPTRPSTENADAGKPPRPDAQNMSQKRKPRET